jgi:protein-S-isoprenylcysteine O-methyltransferase Ste14
MLIYPLQWLVVLLLPKHIAERTSHAPEIPLQVGTPWFWSGIYRFSRHPMYLSMILVYLGVSAASVSWVFLLITAGTVVLQRYQMLREEAYCREIFGPAYLTYMAVTARWFGIPRKR